MKLTALCAAVHEAGHAVALLADPPHPCIDFISIVGLRDGLLGLVEVQTRWQPFMATCSASPEATAQFRQLAYKDVTQHMAGPVAELRWRRLTRAGILIAGRWQRDHCLGSSTLESGSDLDRIRTRLLWAYPDDPHQAFSHAWAETEELVAKHWRAIVLLGRTLRNNGRIGGEELLSMNLLG